MCCRRRTFCGCRRGAAWTRQPQSSVRHRSAEPPMQRPGQQRGGKQSISDTSLSLHHAAATLYARAHHYSVIAPHHALIAHHHSVIAHHHAVVFAVTSQQQLCLIAASRVCCNCRYIPSTAALDSSLSACCNCRYTPSAAAFDSSLSACWSPWPSLHVKVIGQFNLGFIIAVAGDDLFIVDQVLCDACMPLFATRRTVHEDTVCTGRAEPCMHCSLRSL